MEYEWYHHLTWCIGCLVIGIVAAFTGISEGKETATKELGKIIYKLVNKKQLTDEQQKIVDERVAAVKKQIEDMEVL